MEFAILKTMKRSYINEKTLILHIEENMFIYIQQGCISVSNFEEGTNISKRRILSTEDGNSIRFWGGGGSINISEKGDSVCRRCGNTMQMLNDVCNFAKQGDSTPTFPKVWGQLVNWGNPPSLALDATPIQYSTGRTLIERLFWKYLYLKTRSNSHIIH